MYTLTFHAKRYFTGALFPSGFRLRRHRAGPERAECPCRGLFQISLSLTRTLPRSVGSGSVEPQRCLGWARRAGALASLAGVQDPPVGGPRPQLPGNRKREPEVTLRALASDHAERAEPSTFQGNPRSTTHIRVQNNPAIKGWVTIARIPQRRAYFIAERRDQIKVAVHK